VLVMEFTNNTGRSVYPLGAFGMSMNICENGTEMEAATAPLEDERPNPQARVLDGDKIVFAGYYKVQSKDSTFEAVFSGYDAAGEHFEERKAGVTPGKTAQQSAEPSASGSAGAEPWMAGVDIDRESKTPEAVQERFETMTVYAGIKCGWDAYAVSDFGSLTRDADDPRVYRSKMGEADIYYFTDEKGDVNQAMVVHLKEKDEKRGKMQACAAAWALEPNQDPNELFKQIDEIFEKQEGTFGNSAISVSAGGKDSAYIIYRQYVDDKGTVVSEESTNYFAGKFPEILKTYTK